MRNGRGRPEEYKARVIFTTSCECDLLDKFQELARREGKAMNQVLQSLMENYVKIHGSGNPSFEITKWVEQPEFTVDPALRETDDKWDRYITQSSEKELASLEGVLQKRIHSTREEWKKKKFG
jgi:hypothetical protein